MLKCESAVARRWELTLRKEIFWGQEINDDRVITKYFNVPHVAYESDWGMSERYTGKDNGGSYSWEPPLKDFNDINKLSYPVIKVDYIKSTQALELANDAFGDILKVRQKSSWWWTMGITDVLAKLRGLEQIFYDMYDYPEKLHKLMSFLRDGILNKLDFLENNNLLSLNTEGSYVGSGGFGWTNQLPKQTLPGEKVKLLDLWGFCESQETSGVSPEMFKEFVFPYQLPILNKFGLNCYGCCEPLNKRWDIIKNIPNLRRLSISPWANASDMAEKLQSKYVFSLKPNPSYLAQSQIDEDFIRKNLKEILKITKQNNCNVEIIMKDNTTIGKNPQNVIRWCEIAKEESANL